MVCVEASAFHTLIQADWALDREILPHLRDMNLLSPVGRWYLLTLGLLRLLSLPLIVALHLLRERRNQRVVSHLGLWDFLEQEVRGAKPQRIPLTWLLVLDLGAALLLSLAFARPQIEWQTPARNARHVVILIDVSSSMLAQDVLPDRFGRARLEASALLNRLGPRDVATILTFGERSHWIADTRQEGLQEMLAKVTALQAGETGHALALALAQGRSAVQEGLQAEFYIFTDGAFASRALPASIILDLAAGGRKRG
jgi:hypothetical protein